MLLAKDETKEKRKLQTTLDTQKSPTTLRRRIPKSKIKDRNGQKLYSQLTL